MPSTTPPRFTPTFDKAAYYGIINAVRAAAPAVRAAVKAPSFFSRMGAGASRANGAIRQAVTHPLQTGWNATKGVGRFAGKGLLPTAGGAVAGYLRGVENGAVQGAENVMEQQRANPWSSAFLGIADGFGMGDTLRQNYMTQNRPAPPTLGSNWMTSPFSAFGNYATGMVQNRAHDRVLRNLSQRNQSNRGFFF